MGLFLFDRISSEEKVAWTPKNQTGMLHNIGKERPKATYPGKSA